MVTGGFFRQLRILFLLFILFLVAGTTWLTKLRATDWDKPLRVVIYPINGDGSERSSAYIATLDKEVFAPVSEFMQREAERYALPLDEPIRIYLAPEVKNSPPRPPPDRNVLGVMWWSLKMRYWAYREGDYDGPAANIRMFVNYYDPDHHAWLDHSLGLEKGLIGLVNGYASHRLAARNNIIIAHELLHTVGASDKYDLSNNQPIYPHGYAEPSRRPLHPQPRAEIMAGRIPVSKTWATMPHSLSATMIGEQTGREIRWID